MSKASKTSSYKEWLTSKLADPTRAARYLNAALQDSPEMFLKAVRKVVEARQIPVTKIAEEVGFSRESFYRMTAQGGNPTHGNLVGILHALGLSFQVVTEPAKSIADEREPHGRDAPQPPATEIPAALADERNTVCDLTLSFASTAALWMAPEDLSTASTFSVSPHRNAGSHQASLRSDYFGGHISWTGAPDSVTKNSDLFQPA